jgi:hypothetical protein
MSNGHNHTELKVLKITSREGAEAYGVFNTTVDAAGNILLATHEPVAPAGLTLEDLEKEVLMYLEAVRQGCQGEVLLRVDGMVPYMVNGTSQRLESN